MEQIFESDRQRTGFSDPEKQHRVSGGQRSTKGKELQFQRQTSLTAEIRETPKRRNSPWIAKTSAIHNGRISASKTTPANKSSSVNTKERSIQGYCYQPSPDKRFSAEDAQLLIKTIVENRLQNAEYSGDCSAVAKELADKIWTLNGLTDLRDPIEMMKAEAKLSEVFKQFKGVFNSPD